MSELHRNLTCSVQFLKTCPADDEQPSGTIITHLKSEIGIVSGNMLKASATVVKRSLIKCFR